MKYNWWRRHKTPNKLTKKEAFKGKSFLLQQIEHGDYDYSDFYKQAKQELQFAEQEQQRLTNSWIAGPESLKHRLDDIERKYNKRHNKLMEDHCISEVRLLCKLKESLIREFGIDCWSECIDTHTDQTVEQLFHNYRKLATQKLTNKKNKIK